MALRPADGGMVAVVVIAALAAFAFGSVMVFPPECRIPVPPIVLRTVAGSGELVFLSEYSTFSYAEGRPQAPVSDLRFELAEYRAGENPFGPGTVILRGPLGSLNRTGEMQFHDMGAESEFSPGNDFFILLDPPPLTLQLRILDSGGRAIAWNMIWGCI